MPPTACKKMVFILGVKMKIDEKETELVLESLRLSYVSCHNTEKQLQINELYKKLSEQLKSFLILKEKEEEKELELMIKAQEVNNDK
jgi:phosphoribosylanthranilate isomerase